MTAADIVKLRAIESALRTLPGRAKAGHLADWCRDRANELQRERERLETWPDPRGSA